MGFPSIRALFCKHLAYPRSFASSRCCTSIFGLLLRCILSKADSRERAERRLVSTRLRLIASSNGATYLCRGHKLLWLCPLSRLSGCIVIVHSSIRTAEFLPWYCCSRWRRPWGEVAVHPVHDSSANGSAPVEMLDSFCE